MQNNDKSLEGNRHKFLIEKIKLKD